MNVRRSINILILLIASVWALFPIVWGLGTSLKTESMAVSYPPQWIPKPVTFKNYIDIITKTPTLTYIKNSIIVGFGTILVALFIAVHASYAAVRIHFPLKNVIMWIILTCSMIPGISILPGLYIVSQLSGLHDTYTVLILVYATWRLPLAIWIIKNFFESIPKELEEAAVIDGCSRLQAMYRITLPLALPGLAASALMIFVYVWNDFIFSSTLTISPDMRTIQVGLYQFWGDVGVEWARFTGYTILGSFPVILLFLYLQKWFVAGLTAGAVKH